MNNIIKEVTSIDWNANCKSAQVDATLYQTGQQSLLLLCNWCRQLENLYSNNCSLAFIREAQVSAQDFFCLVSLGLYKASASSLRTILESFLYFTYFKDHPVELTSLTRVEKYYLSKKEIIDYHKLHTHNFINLSRHSGLTTRLESSYSKISSIIHGQIPGAWHSSHIFTEKKYDSKLADSAIKEFIDVADIINLLLLVILSDEEWNNISVKIKQILTAKLSSSLIMQLGRN